MFLICLFPNGQAYCNKSFLLQNLNVLIAENMSLKLNWWSACKELHLGSLERAAHHPEILGSRFDAVTEKDMCLDAWEKQYGCCMYENKGVHAGLGNQRQTMTENFNSLL